MVMSQSLATMHTQAVTLFRAHTQCWCWCVGELLFRRHTSMIGALAELEIEIFIQIATFTTR